MSYIQEPSRIMVSDAIADSLQDFDPIKEAESNYIIVNMTLNSGDERFGIAGNVVSYLLDEHFELEIRAMIDDAFLISGCWPTISVEEFEFHRKPQVIKFEGKRKISALRIQEINHSTQMCVIAMKLCKELHIYRMEFHMNFKPTDEMCDECAEEMEMGMGPNPSCCGEESDEPVYCNVCDMPIESGVCDCCVGMTSTGHAMQTPTIPHEIDVVDIRMHEGFQFDKFMDNILIKESHKVVRGDSPMRERARRHQEYPINRIKYGVRL